ncbi:hypothetical protein PCK1_002497 [Pneumocystis canis]|nr:hypothetical protein PCK1_002497 [Pneumocystis canis]
MYKILAIGRLSRVFQVLREESESITELKTITGNTKLPAGTLILGAEGIKNAITTFEDAKISDIENERFPPEREDVDKRHERIIQDLMFQTDERDLFTNKLFKTFSL